jgi:hypothetical protein
MKLYRAILILIFFTAAQATQAYDILPAARLAMPLLEENGTARAMAMGSAFVSIAQGTAALFWNPAGLGSLANPEFGLHHNSGLDNDMDELLVYGTNAESLGGFAGAINYEDYGSFESRDNLGNLTGINTAGGFGIDLGWGRQLVSGFYAGMAIKADQQTLAGVSYNSFACDLGILWSVSQSLNIGMAYSNLGTRAANSQLASGLRAGISYGLNIQEANILLLAIAAEIQSNGPAGIDLGAEDTVLGVFAIRLGYVLDTADQELSGLTGLTGGLGIKIQDITLDYACALFGDLGINNRISFTYNIPLPKPEQQPVK